MLKCNRKFFSVLRCGVFSESKIMSGSKDRVDLSALRVGYHSEDVKADFSEKDPLKLFDSWFALARNTDGIQEPNAMALATADASGKPSARYVLLKGYGNDGFCFCTNYESRKGKEIAQNPSVALLFYWEPLHLQVRIEGSIVKDSEKVSEEYFHSRPRSSQISASVSNQSTVIEGKDVLIKKQRELQEKYADESIVIPKPPYWGLYKVIPQSFEFWCGRTNRLHDRLRFRLPGPQEVPDEKFSFSGENGWIYEYLSP